MMIINSYHPIQDHMLFSKMYWQMAQHDVCWSLCADLVAI
jgi:hypothetical protein